MRQVNDSESSLGFIFFSMHKIDVLFMITRLIPYIPGKTYELIAQLDNKKYNDPNIPNNVLVAFSAGLHKRTTDRTMFDYFDHFATPDEYAGHFRAIDMRRAMDLGQTFSGQRDLSYVRIRDIIASIIKYDKLTGESEVLYENPNVDPRIAQHIAI